jgi:inositol-phosphate phosphatase/L-galactose 1-phosphate phosphatase/histidinol-phosphatase
VSTPSALAPSALAPFAVALVEPALAELGAAYGDLVAGFAGNAALGDLVREHGPAAALASPHLDAIRKQNRELVTAADRRAERVMREMVEREYPGHGIAGEEYGLREGAPGQPWLWVFDPVDGTSALVRTALAQAYGLPAPEAGFGVLIGLLYRDQPVLGVIAELTSTAGCGLAVTHRWVGVTGEPTTVDGRPAQGPADKPLAEATLACTVPEVMFGDAASFRALKNATAALKTDLNCVGYARLLGYGIDLVVERDMSVHDAAGLLPVLHGAGVTVTDHSGRPVRFDAATREGEYRLFAAAAHLHSEALAVFDETTSAGADRTAHLGYVAKFGG